MKISNYLTHDLAGLLLKYMEHYDVHNETLYSEIKSYTDKSPLTKQKWLAHINNLGELSCNPSIGIDIGQLIEAQHGGVMAYLASSCAYLGEALLQFDRYQGIVYGDRSEIELVGDLVKITWPDHINAEDMWQSDEVLLSSFAKYIRDITGNPGLRPHSVGFRHTEPEYIDRYYEVFGSNVSFGRNALYVDFSAGLLATPIQNSDEGLKKLLENQAQSLLDVFKLNDDFEQDLQKALLKILQEGSASLEALAQALSVTPRTLQRRLDERGYNFTDLLKSTRKELALFYLQEKAVSLTDIAFLLAYSEQSAFTRAFKQWYGISPKQYLKNP